MQKNESRPLLYLVVNNHFDPTWRRCWRRRFVSQGMTFASYADIEEYYLLDNIELARRHPEYKFEVECSAIVRMFLERHPEKRSFLKKLAREGRFCIPGAGDQIIDSNMVHGESLVRNFVDGLLWAEKELGRKTPLAIRNDAFGNSAQLPQILRGCEIAWVTGLFYSNPGGRYWRGLDGSTILHATIPAVARGGGADKYAPCATCSGTGRVRTKPCRTCMGRGIVGRLARLPGAINQEYLRAMNAGFVRMDPEELLPNPQLIRWARKTGKKYDVRFSLEEEALPHVKPWLDAVDSPPAEHLHRGRELNPNNTGCLVTRIRTKQTVRRQEYALLAAETLSLMAAQRGFPYPKNALRRVRRAQFFTMFHDAITGTMVDPAYAELEDSWKRIDAETGSVRSTALSALAERRSRRNAEVLSVLNLTGQEMSSICTAVVTGVSTGIALTDAGGNPAPVLGTRKAGPRKVAVEFVARALHPHSSTRYRVKHVGEDPNRTTSLRRPTIENRRFRVNADEHGLLSVFDKKLGKTILAAGQYRPGELILEHDEGSPWATLHPDQARIPLSKYTRLVAGKRSRHCQRLEYLVETPWSEGFSSRCLLARITVRLAAGIERVDFRLNAEWDGFNHRLRVAMPVPKAGRHFYEIPYGMLERKPYAARFGWTGANGDWPAVNWAGVETPAMSVALFNKGTPSYRIEPGRDGGDVILLSLLRSPCLPTYLHEPAHYSMTEWNGMRDAGNHEFEYAVSAYDRPFADSAVVNDADSYNAGAAAVPGAINLPPMPRVHSDHVRIAAVKRADSGHSMILRLTEFRGRSGTAAIVLPFPVKRAAQVNLLEREPRELPVIGNRIRCRIRPWELVTLRLE